MTGAAFYIIHTRGWGKSAEAAETAFPAQNVLVVKNAGSGRVYGKWSLKEHGEFAIEFIHSVNLSPVTEFFRIENGVIRLFAVCFSSFGAGMQSDLRDGQTLSRDGERMMLSGLNALFTELSYIVGTVSDHLLIINGESVSLRELGGRNAHIAISLE